MIDRIFSAALTFCLLIGGTLAIGSALLGLDRPALTSTASKAQVRVVQLEPVLITAKRLAPATKLAAVTDAEPGALRQQ
jgi:hypothetical protein